ncbi:LAFE_0G05028g1_1 [Lachancea fermentati]|uniref:LAFE_0G05028g1_1 n=1 Tax=Lachancea fermentati TaxID=4955 RepID=A0A1G4MH22_LACFM|nr:LAFE_0G05028g1_1 [Lachancea fermentati]
MQVIAVDNGVFPLQKLPNELMKEVFSNLPQSDRVNLCLVNRKINKIATNLLYRQIYLNDSNVVRSDYMNLAINWSLFYIPFSPSEENSRRIANAKLKLLIRALRSNIHATRSVEWIRINWDLDPVLQRTVLSILCNEGTALQRLENVTDPECNEIIATGKFSSKNLISFDMAPPNPHPEQFVPVNYIPNLRKYLKQRISSSITYMNLFIDPVLLFNYIHPLSQKLQIVDLKLHWRNEFYPKSHFKKSLTKRPLSLLSDIFDTRTLKVLTIISWNEYLVPRELDMFRQFKEFTNIEDLSLISIKQEIFILMGLFTCLPRLRRLKTDFLEELLSQSARPEIFLTLLHYCRDLEFIDLRFEGLDPPIISTIKDRFQITQKCHCEKCMHVFDNIIYQKLFLFPEDGVVASDLEDRIKDIFTMMRSSSFFPYSKACDCYPSVRTLPMNLDEFVSKMNRGLLFYRKSKSQLVCNPVQDPLDDIEDDVAVLNMVLPHKALTRQDVIDCYHAMIHHYRRTYVTFLSRFPKLRFLVLNDIATTVVVENGERVLQPVFYNEGFTTNLAGWTKKPTSRRGSKDFVVGRTTNWKG